MLHSSRNSIPGRKAGDMALLVLGYPTLAAADYRRIQAFRADHDPQFRIVAPHVTLVFALDDSLEETLIAQVRRIAKAQPKVGFVLRSAKLMPQLPGEEDAPIFLVPDEGYASLVQLHDELYNGPIAAHLRQDIPFIPHITIGRTRDRSEAQQVVAELNRQELAMPGAIPRLTVVRYVNGLVSTLTETPLLG